MDDNEIMVTAEQELKFEGSTTIGTRQTRSFPIGAHGR